MKNVPVIIIGAGQAGLALSYHLRERSIAHRVLEAHPQVGDNWRTRWDSLSLFSPNIYNGLPGLDFPGDPWHLPTKDEAADYLASYARHFALPVTTGVRVEGVVRADQGYELETSDGKMYADRVVVATGAYQTPRIPALDPPAPEGLYQVHSSAYRRPSEVPVGPALVVGAGASGQQIARDLIQDRPVCLAGPDVPNLPRKFLWIDIYWWLYKFGLITKKSRSQVGQAQKEKKEVTVGENMKSLKRAGVQRRDRLVGFEGTTALFKDGRRMEGVAAVVWATGYRNQYPWLEMDCLDGEGRPAHTRGISDKVPGLYFIGLPYLYRVNSSLMGGVAADAAHLGSAIAEDLRVPTRSL